ncbi:LADA_0B10396g1_1 [Lachancea dasiensis]|uniref:LADA_0B10396g1_1 n=1 Tax=Lachancea dasiensis TaxID=1072105 RepID=A0A1G4IV58_9SACH|nr:LADA_0B10396g1_1 [Lachancea dasiensis]
MPYRDQTKPYYLPVLLNPLLNAVFNCPTPQTSPLKKVFSRIRHRKFILIAPSTEVLNEYEDLESGSSLQDLCYSNEFVADHILFLDGREEMGVDDYKTLSGKTVLLRNQQAVIFTGDGFGTRRRCRMMEAQVLTNFNDYLEGSRTYPVIYVDIPFVGRLARCDEWQIIKTSFPIAPKASVKNKETSMLAAADLISFEQMLRINPSHAEKLKDIFDIQRKTLASSSFKADSLASDFITTCAKAAKVVEPDVTFRNLPDLRMHIHEYVELNLYDDFWAQLTNSMRGSEIESLSDYKVLKNISISQLPSFLFPQHDAKFDMRYVTQVEKNLEEAVNCFKKLSLTNCHSAKARVIVETLQTLSRTITVDDKIVTIDADTLVSLLVVTVCRAEVRDLKSHSFYLQEFAKSSAQITFGILAYGMSTLEGVLSYFENPEKLHLLERNCEMNLRFWSCLSSATLDSDVASFPHLDKALTIRTAAGQSALSYCVQNKNFEAFELIATNYENLFPLEDILYDENVDGSNLVIQMLDSGCYGLAGTLVEMLCKSCTREELARFLNKPNRYGRISGHYIMHSPQLISKVGALLDWEKQDCNGHTPLFVIIRAYDQPNYEQMISDAYTQARRWCKLQNRSFQPLKHSDRKGNTLLHIIKIKASVLIADPLANLNATNKKGLTPLMVYAKYNRIENVKDIIKDNRLVVDKFQEGLYLTSFDYVKNPAVLVELGRTSSYKGSQFAPSIYARSIKCEHDDWVLWMTCKRDTDASTFAMKRPLRFIQNFMLLFIKAYPRTFVPVENIVEELRDLSRVKIININRLATQLLLKKVSIALSLMIQENGFEESFYSSNLNLSLGPGCRESHTSDGDSIEPEEMTSIQKVLKFNRSELMSVRALALTLKKIAIFGDLKGFDMNKSDTMFCGKTNNVFNSYQLQQSAPLVVDLSSKSSDFGSLTANVTFLQICTEALITNIEKALSVDISNWWHTYGELAALRHEYQRNFPGNVRPNISASGGLFASYIETKRTKLEQSISKKIQHSSDHLLHLAKCVRKENEQLAVEVNKYLTFKNEFWVFMTVKEHAESNIKVLQERLICLKEGLNKLNETSFNEPVNTLHTAT